MVRKHYLLHCIEVGRLNPRDFPSKALLDRFHLIPGLLVVHKVDGNTSATEPSRTPYPVYVCFQIRCHVVGSLVRPTFSHERKIVVDDHVDLHDVYASGNDVGGNKDLCIM